jgi:hypothetical protein
MDLTNQPENQKSAILYATALDAWDTDPDPANDFEHVSKTAQIGIDGGMTFYEDGINDAGPDGWRRWAESYQTEESFMEGTGTGSPSKDGPINENTNTNEKDNEKMGIQIEQTRYEVLPVGEYPAEITEIEQDDGQFGPQCKFEFTLINAKNAGHTLLGWTSAKFSPKSKLFKWTKAALNTQISPQYNFDSDDLIGKRVNLTLVIRENDDGAEFNRIEEVRAFDPKSNGGNVVGTQPPIEEDEIPF